MQVTAGSGLNRAGVLDMDIRTEKKGNDFLKGPMWKCILKQAVPLTIAQFVHLLYNVVDRIYIGHMGEGSSLALTGVGLTFPIVTLIMGFAALFGIFTGQTAAVLNKAIRICLECIGIG